LAPGFGGETRPPPPPFPILITLGGLARRCGVTGVIIWSRKELRVKARKRKRAQARA
jgi:hypothetical protein